MATTMATPCKNTLGGRLFAALLLVFVVLACIPVRIMAETPSAVTPQAAGAHVAPQGADLQIVAMLTPAVSVLVTFLVRKATGLGSWALPVIAALVGLAYHTATAYAGCHAINPVMGILLGLAGTGLHQIRAQLLPPEDNGARPAAGGPTFKG